MTRRALVVPVEPGECDGAWLAAALGRADPVGVTRVTRIGEGFGLSSRIFRIERESAADPATVVVKLWATDGPVGWTAGTREVDLLRAFGDRLGPRVPRCFHAAIDEGARRGVLVLEDMHPAEQGDCLKSLPRKRSEAVARALASLHARWWESAELLAATSWLPVHAGLGRDDAWIEDRRASFLERFGGRIDPLLRRVLDAAAIVQARAAQRLAGAPATLLHADLHLDNVMFLGGTDEPVLLDWARAVRGPAAFDLAEVVFAMARPGDGDAAVEAWTRELHRQGVEAPGAADLAHQLGAALVRQVLACTLGVARWQPASSREAAMIDTGLERATRAVHEWSRRDPGLFAG